MPLTLGFPPHPRALQGEDRLSWVGVGGMAAMGTAGESPGHVGPGATSGSWFCPSATSQETGVWWGQRCAGRGPTCLLFLYSFHMKPQPDPSGLSIHTGRLCGFSCKWP